VRRSAEETEQILRGLAMLLHAGLPLAEGAYLLAGDSEPILRKRLEALGKQLSEGVPLSRAMEAEKLFPHHITGMIAIGERTGRLEETLTALADDQAERRKIIRQVKAAVAGPGLILLLMTAVILILLTVVLPIFEQVYASLGNPMTGIAGMLLVFGQSLRTAMPWIFGAVLLLSAAVAVAWTRKPWKQAGYRWWMRQFGDRGLFRRFADARFARAMAMGLESGLLAEEALILAGKILAENPAAAQRCVKAISVLEAGGTLSQSMAAGGFLSSAQGRLLDLGLRGGKAEQVMAEIADNQMEQAQEALERRVAFVEPALVAVASVLVGAILLAVMLPLLDLLAVIG